MEQTWLSLDALCTKLGITKKHALWLAKHDYIVMLRGLPDRSQKFTGARYLDPTPEYAEKLKTTEAFYGRLNPLPKDFDLNAFLTIRELAQVMGRSVKATQLYTQRHKIPSTRVGIYNLYSIATVRDVLWNTQGRKLAHQVAPFLISELIEFFLKYHAEESSSVPTDAAFAADDLLHKKFVRLCRMKSPAREKAMAELWQTIETAKQVDAALRVAGSSHH